MMRPKIMFLAIFGHPEYELPLSTVAMHPCPWCMEVNRKTGHLRPIQRLTQCPVCRSVKAIVVPGLWPGVLKTFQPPKEEGENT